MSYAELLLSDEWQEKRLEIISRDRWKCRLCGNKTIIAGTKTMAYLLEESDPKYHIIHNDQLKFYEPSEGGYVTDDVRMYIPWKFAKFFKCKIVVYYSKIEGKTKLIAVRKYDNDDKNNEDYAKE
jgi:hypothetical protein